MDIGTQFRNLHQKGKPFILANAWDLGSAKMLAGLGAQAIGTSSAAQAFTLGRPDMGTVSRDEALAHAQSIVETVSVPVSGDFENGFGDSPEDVAQTVRMAAEVGLAGISIEDTALPTDAPYAFDLAVERVRAGASAARALGKDFVFCARADGIMNGHYDCDEAIKRLQAFEAAGADCLYAPLPNSMEDLARICASVSAPVNALVAGDYRNYNVSDFANIGVARISLGSTLARITHAAIQNAASEFLADGSFQGLLGAAKGADIDALLMKGSKE